ncbi:MAG: TonB-dependent receptor [Halieaceae bacterium]|jgi:iron complex outermembrane receptor protein
MRDKQNTNHSAVVAGAGFVLSALAVAVPQVAFSQSSALEEVIVTAERRAQDAQDVPIALTIIGGSEISPSGISSISDVALKTPNLTFTQFNIGEPQLFLRGLGTTIDSAGADPTVSVFIDDVYVGRSAGATSDLYDLERIEVLRGPQGTLYGRNVTGGAISIVTKRPSNEFEAKLGVTVGNYGLTVLRGLVDGPIGDNLAGNLSFSKRDRDGYAYSNRSGQELDDADNFSLRGKLLWDISDNTELLLGFDYSTDDNNGQCRNLTKLDNPAGDHNAGGVFVPVLKQIKADTNSEDPRTCAMTIEQYAERDVFGLSARLQMEFTNDLSLTSITAYRELEYSWLQELGGLDSPPNLLSVEDNEGDDADQISQEFRLTKDGDRLFWVAGAYYFKENVDRFANVPIFFGPGSPVAPGALLDRSWLQSATNTSMALFGQVVWSMTDALALTLGGRHTWDEKEMDNAYYSSPGNEVYNFKGLEESWDEFTPRVTVDWQVTDDHMLFATWSKGYKSGVFISQNTTAALAETPLEPEEATNMEIGAKTRWFDNRLQFNLVYFDLENENQQLFRLENFTLVSENFGTESSGIELDFIAALGKNLTLSGMYASLDAEIVGGQFAGNVAPRSPDYKYSVALNYNAALGNGAILDFDASVSYSDNWYMEATNQGVSYMDDYSIVDASVRYTSSGGNWEVTLWGKNLSDELVTSHSIVSSFGGSVELFAPPRTYGVTANYFFD